MQAVEVVFTVSLDDNLNKILAEKRKQYQALVVELKDLHQLKEK